MTMTKPTSEQVTFTAADSGATLRNLVDKVREVVSAKDFGAIGDGVADDTAAIQAALNTGMVVYLPAGIYKITDTIKIPTNSGLKGAGQTKTVIRGNMAKALVSSPDVTVRHYNITIADLMIDNTSSATAGGICLDLSKISLAFVINVWCIRCAVGVKLFATAYYNDFYSLRIDQCLTGISISGGSNENRFYAIKMGTVQTGCYIDGGTNNVFNGGSIEGFTTAFTISPVTISQYVRIYNYRFENLGAPSGTGIIVSAIAQSVIIQGCMFVGLLTDISDASSSVIHISPEYSSPYLVVQKLQFAPAPHSIAREATLKATSGTVFVRNSADSGFAPLEASNITARGNLAVGTTGGGIRSGTGTPEGNVAAVVGTLFLRTDGGVGTTLYVKETGTGNTGWAAK